MSSSKEVIDVEFNLDIKSAQKKLEKLESVAKRIKKNEKFGLDSRGNPLSDRRKERDRNDSVRLGKEINSLKKEIMSNRNLPAIQNRSVVSSGDIKTVKGSPTRELEGVKHELIVLNNALSTTGNNGRNNNGSFDSSTMIAVRNAVKTELVEFSSSRPDFANMKEADGVPEEFGPKNSSSKEKATKEDAKKIEEILTEVAGNTKAVNDTVDSAKKEGAKASKSAVKESKARMKSDKERKSTEKKMLSSVRGISSKFGKLTAMLREASFYKGLITSSYANLMKLGDASAEAERNVFKTRGFKSSLSGEGVSDFDNSANMMSRITGLNKYEASSKLADVGGLLQSSDVKIGKGVMSDFVETSQRLSISAGVTFEEATVKALAIMKGRTGANMGVAGFKRTSNNPEVILKELLEFQKKNRTTDLAMKENTLTALMQSIKSAPGGMLSGIIDNYGDLMSSIFEPIKEFTDVFYKESLFARVFKTISEDIKKIDPKSIERFRNSLLGVTTILSGSLPGIIDNFDAIVLIAGGAKFGAVGLALGTLAALFKTIAKDESSNTYKLFEALTDIFISLDKMEIGPLDALSGFLENTLIILDFISGMALGPTNWLAEKLKKKAFGEEEGDGEKEGNEKTETKTRRNPGESTLLKRLENGTNTITNNYNFGDINSIDPYNFVDGVLAYT